jgi:hypothetical protein
MIIKDIIQEKLITFGDKAYPKFGQIIIMAGGAGCFGPDTLVEVENGVKKIKDIVIGDKVWSLNESTNTKELQEVSNTFIYDSKTKPMVELQFEMSDGKIETVVCTEDHEFYIDGKYIQAKDIPM